MAIVWIPNVIEINSLTSVVFQKDTDKGILNLTLVIIVGQSGHVSSENYQWKK